MLEWIAEKVLAIIAWVPALIVEQSSPNFMLVRTMFAIICITLIVYIITMFPSSTITRYMGRVISVFKRKR
jgi:hypothetical protein